MMERLRAAIVAILDEDLDMVGEPVGSTDRLIDAFNEIEGVEKIEY